WTVFGGNVVEVALEFSGRAARLVSSGTYLSEEEKSPLPKGRLLYRAKVAGLAEIGRWIMGFGPEVKVLEPSELRQWVVDQAEGILAHNS
ncbi:MAG: WYL domain-containing protein, partial [Candidatus Zixiibacteriota bacterium]